MAGEKNTLYLSGSDIGHSYMVGTTAMGKSRIIDQFMKEETSRCGITTEELILDMAGKLDDQGTSSVHLQEEEQPCMKDKRFEAVKAAYWEATPEDDTYLLDDVLHGHISEVDEFTHEQKKILFMMLPETIIGLIIKWGIDDTEAREQISEFVEINLDEVRAAIGL